MNRNNKMVIGVALPTIVALLVAGGIVAWLLSGKAPVRVTDGGQGAAIAPASAVAVAGVSGDAAESRRADQDAEEGAAPADPAGEQTFPCDFEYMVGQAPNNSQLRRLHRPFRVLPPGAVATMDYNPARLNLKTDADGVVTEVVCN